MPLRSWSEPLVREIPAIVAAPPFHPVDDHPVSCPGCGTTLRVTVTATTSNGAAGPRSAPLTLQRPPDAAGERSFDEAILHHKRELIVQALERNDGVMTRAARSLGLKYTTFVAMVHRLGIPDPDEERATG